jgi:hypothetical protein
VDGKHSERQSQPCSRFAAAPGEISFGHGLPRKNKPHELQHRSHEMDEDSGEERPKPVQHCDVVKLQQKRGDPDRKQWIKNTILGTLLNRYGRA